MSREAGLLTQICVWAPERVADLVRELCSLVAGYDKHKDSCLSIENIRAEVRRTLKASRFNLSVQLDHLCCLDSGERMTAARYPGRWRPKKSPRATAEA